MTITRKIPDSSSYKPPGMNAVNSLFPEAEDLFGVIAGLRYVIFDQGNIRIEQGSIDIVPDSASVELFYSVALRLHACDEIDELFRVGPVRRSRNDRAAVRDGAGAFGGIDHRDVAVLVHILQGCFLQCDAHQVFTVADRRDHVA